MKTTNYRLQTEIEQLSADSQRAWFEMYIHEVLESDKPYHVKADYIGLSFEEIQNKIDYLSSDINEMKHLKATLTQAKGIAQEVIASVLTEYGIDRLEGTIISSLTLTPAKVTTKSTLTILNPVALIELGYAKVIVDEEAVKQAMHTAEEMDSIDSFVEVSMQTQEIPAKLKVNTKRKRKQHEDDIQATMEIPTEATHYHTHHHTPAMEALELLKHSA